MRRLGYHDSIQCRFMLHDVDNVVHGPDMKTFPPPWGFLKTVIFGHHVI